MSANTAALLQTQAVPEDLKDIGVQSVDKVLRELKLRASKRTTLDVAKIGDLGLHWEDQGPSHSKSGFYGRIDGREMRLGEGGVKTLNRLMKGGNMRHWQQYSDPNAFVKAATNILDNPDRRSDSGILLRHDGLEVNCFLPGDFEVRDAHEMLGDFVGMLNDNLGDIKGINVDERGYGDHCSYRVIMGDNLMPAATPEHGQFMMFLLSMSETGQSDSRTSVGTYRFWCTNSAISEQNISQWNHRSGSESRFYDATGETIRLTGMLKSQFSLVFGELLKMPLEHDPVELLNTMKSVKAITREHWSSAKTFAEIPTEDGRKCETHYDLFNALTRGARELQSLGAREGAEQAALHLFTAPGGLYQQLKSAASRHRINNGENVVGLN